MNARDNEIFKVSYLFAQKQIEHDIYNLDNPNLTLLLITEAVAGGIL